jgi:ribonuclease Y
MVYIISVVVGLIGLGIGCGAMAMLLRGKNSEVEKALQEAKEKTASSDADLANRSRELEIESREKVQAEVARLRESIEKDTAERRRDLKESERRLREQEKELERRGHKLDGRDKALTQQENDINQRVHDAQELVSKQREELQRIAGLTTDEAREVLLERVAEESRKEMNAVVARIEREAEEHAEEKARKIIVMAIQRCAVDQTTESSVSVVPLPSDELKGRIIGREGRNIRTFEQLSGTDLIIDDTPEAVVVSCFEPVRREIARVALANLVSDGRIHPGRIEDVLEKAKVEVGNRMREAAEAAVAEAHVRLPRPVLEVFGRLLYRTSYGQNILKHSVEVATIAASIAAEVGANVNVAKRGALLHDIGKALDHEHEGTHIDLGVELLRRNREQEAVIAAVAEHHLDVANMSSLESVIVQLADAISSARPGARRENAEIYVKRLENLERIANSFQGVEKSFAIQAGRELRIVVKPGDVDDLTAIKISREVATQIQDEMTYPGEIRVTVIRETRAVEYAK